MQSINRIPSNCASATSPMQGLCPIAKYIPCLVHISCRNWDYYYFLFTHVLLSLIGHPFPRLRLRSEFSRHWDPKSIGSSNTWQTMLNALNNHCCNTRLSSMVPGDGPLLTGMKLFTKEVQLGMLNFFCFPNGTFGRSCFGWVQR